MQHEIEIGSRIQQSLLVAEPPGDVEGLSIAVVSIPSLSIDGDFFEFVRQHDECVDVIVGDVMGKGIPAALLGAAAKNHFLRALQYLNPSSLKGPALEEIVMRVHRELTPALIRLESFATFCYARFDVRCGRVDLVDGGHTRTIRYWKGAGSSEFLSGPNMPLGFSEGEMYREFSVPLEPGDVFLFYSDGVTEARNHTDEMFGEGRLRGLVRELSHLEPEDIVRNIKNEVFAFAGSDQLSDDFCCIAIKIDEKRALRKSGRQLTHRYRCAGLPGIGSRNPECLSLFSAACPA